MTPIYINAPSPMESLKAFAWAFGAGALCTAIVAALLSTTQESSPR